MGSQQKGHRRPSRLGNYDYSKPGYYNVTICTYNRKHLFGEVINKQMVLNRYGAIAQHCWKAIPDHFPNVEIDQFQIMPNHMHGIIAIVGAGLPRPDKFNNKSQLTINNQIDCFKGRGNRAPTVGQIVAYFKYVTAKQSNILRNTPGTCFWQRNYYEHIVRNEKELTSIREYIITNPENWKKDKYYV